MSAFKLSARLRVDRLASALLVSQISSEDDSMSRSSSRDSTISTTSTVDSTISLATTVEGEADISGTEDDIECRMPGHNHPLQKLFLNDADVERWVNAIQGYMRVVFLSRIFWWLLWGLAETTYSDYSEIMLLQFDEMEHQMTLMSISIIQSIFCFQTPMPLPSMCDWPSPFTWMIKLHDAVPSVVEASCVRMETMVGETVVEEATFTAQEGFPFRQYPESEEDDSALGFISSLWPSVYEYPVDLLDQLDAQSECDEECACPSPFRPTLQRGITYPPRATPSSPSTRSLRRSPRSTILPKVDLATPATTHSEDHAEVVSFYPGGEGWKHHVEPREFAWWQNPADHEVRRPADYVPFSWGANCNEAADDNLDRKEEDRAWAKKHFPMDTSPDEVETPGGGDFTSLERTLESLQMDKDTRKVFARVPMVSPLDSIIEVEREEALEWATQVDGKEVMPVQKKSMASKAKASLSKIFRRRGSVKV